MTKPTPLDTCGLFRPVSNNLVVLLRALQPDDWQRPTVARRWVVRDVVALAAVIDAAMRGLPHAYRDVAAAPGEIVCIDVHGASGGQWALVREQQRWTLWRGKPEAATTHIRLSDHAAGKVLFNALSPSDAAHAIHVDGRQELAIPFQRARSVIV